MHVNNRNFIVVGGAWEERDAYGPLLAVDTFADAIGEYCGIGNKFVADISPAYFMLHSPMSLSRWMLHVFLSRFFADIFLNLLFPCTRLKIHVLMKVQIFGYSLFVPYCHIYLQHMKRESMEASE